MLLVYVILKFFENVKLNIFLGRCIEIVFLLSDLGNGREVIRMFGFDVIFFRVFYENLVGILNIFDFILKLRFKEIVYKNLGRM